MYIWSLDVLVFITVKHILNTRVKKKKNFATKLLQFAIENYNFFQNTSLKLFKLQNTPSIDEKITTSNIVKHPLISMF